MFEYYRYDIVERRCRMEKNSNIITPSIYVSGNMMGIVKRRLNLACSRHELKQTPSSQSITIEYAANNIKNKQLLISLIFS